MFECWLSAMMGRTPECFKYKTATMPECWLLVVEETNSLMF